MNQYARLSLYQEHLEDGSEQELLQLEIANVQYTDWSDAEESAWDGMLQLSMGEIGPAQQDALATVCGFDMARLQQQGHNIWMRLEFYRRGQVFFALERVVLACRTSADAPQDWCLYFAEYGTDSTPVHAALFTWIQLWQAGEPPPRYWAQWDEARQQLWLAFNLAMHASKPQVVRTQYVVLDGRLILSPQAFYCEYAEQLCGIGGYAGYNLDAVDDCLFGGWFADLDAANLSVEWRYFEVSQQVLAPSFIEHIRAIFQDHHMTLLLQSQ